MCVSRSAASFIVFHFCLLHSKKDQTTNSKANTRSLLHILSGSRRASELHTHAKRGEKKQRRHSSAKLFKKVVHFKSILHRLHSHSMQSGAIVYLQLAIRQQFSILSSSHSIMPSTCACAHFVILYVQCIGYLP